METNNISRIYEQNNATHAIRRASITYEAALALPLFVGILIFFLSLFRLQMIQEILSFTAYDVAEETSLYGFVFYDKPSEAAGEKANDYKGIDRLTDIDGEEGLYSFLIGNLKNLAGKVADAIYFSFRMGMVLPDDAAYDNYIKGGMRGISYWGSEVLYDDMVVIKMNYDFIVPVFERIIPPIEVSQYVAVRSFTGHRVPKKKIAGDDENEDEDDDEVYVYIAETGQVYHMDRNCTYIKLSIKEASYSEIGSLRSTSGGKYYECSICKKNGQAGSKVYITDYGDVYHYTLQCSGIKRTVSVIKLSEAGDRRPCSRCAKDARGNQ